MAQYYQIVGQGHSFTLEDLQRYCPNLCLDGIIVNQDDQQQYAQQQVVVQQTEQPNDNIIVSDGVQPQLVVRDGLQYQPQYIIRHEPPPPQPPQDFQQQQQQQQTQHQALQRQVYYTSDLPVDAQVVLQQAQQIIDASLMQQSSTQRPQHLVSPAHVLSQPVIHPAQPPPPQPPPQPSAPPAQQQNPQPPPPSPSAQQLSRTSPQLIQHLQQQQQQIQLQQLQQQQLQHLQQQQQQQQQQQHQQHIQPQQLQHQQVVMHAAYINQTNSPTRQPPPRLINPAAAAGSSGVTLVRTPVRTVRPRRPVRASLTAAALQVPARLLNPNQVQNPQSPAPVVVAGPVTHRGPRPRGPPRLINTHVTQHPRPRQARPRLPTPQQQQQHQQLTQHVLNQQVHQQQVHTQQLNQLKMSNQQQILLNQQNQANNQPQASRIVNQPNSSAHLGQPQLTHTLLQGTHNNGHLTQQGTLIQQGALTQQGTLTQQGALAQQGTLAQQGNLSQQGALTQQGTLTVMQQRSSPHQIQQTIKKVIVQPNNASDMDDLEESITAAIVQKTNVNEHMNSPQQFHTPPPTRPSLATTSQAHYTPQFQINYESQQPQQSMNQMLMDSDCIDDERLVNLGNGQRITFAEYKRLQQQIPRQPSQLQQSRETVRQTLVRSKEQQRPVQRVPPMQAQPTSQENGEVSTGTSEQSSEAQSAKMLIFLQNGEQRLITFTLPKESCTLQEVLEQVNVPFSEDTHIQCMQNTSSDIDYFVSVGSTTRIEEMLENHPMLLGDLNRTSPSVLSQQPQTSEMSTPEKAPCPETASNSPESPRSPPPRYVDGMLAVCKLCGYSGIDFNRCQRCKRIFTEEPKSIPSKKVEQKKKEPEKIFERQNSIGDGIRLNLLKSTAKTLNHTKAGIQEKKTPRARKPRGKQPDPEPVILTLSSDEEDSNSSMHSFQHEQIFANSKEPSLSEIEGNISDSSYGAEQMDDESREDHGAFPPSIVASLACRTIRIGSYKFTPKERVYISTKGIKIVAPSVKNESRDVALQINIKEIVKILVHFGRALPVLFLYTLSKCGVYVRKTLDMTDETGPYFNPSSMVETYKRITLLPESISEDSRSSLKLLFGKIMDELNVKEANDILLRTCPREGTNVTKMTTRSLSSSSSAKSSNPAEIRQILIYPPGKGGIPINTEDYMCLAQDQFLNDVIIDFYLKHLVRETLTDAQREKTHIFSTFFYKRLTTKPSKVNKSSNPHEWDSNLTAAQKRHARVKTWTKNVNLFDKDYVVVPINENCHWFVAIICFPSLDGCRSMIDNRTVLPQDIRKRERRSSMQIGSTTITPLNKQEQLTLNCDSDNLSERDEAEAEESDLDMQCDSDEEEEKPVEKKIEIPCKGRNEPIKQPCILIFDSLAGASRSRVVATLRDYITCEYQTKISPNKVFNKDNMKGSCPKIPQQNNFTDCGLYLLQYVEQFFKAPILDYSLPIKQLANWFDEIVVTRKREEISQLLKKLMHKYNPDSHLTLPDITFPTLNGKLIETEENHDDSDDKTTSQKDRKESEGPTLTIVKQMPTGDILVKTNFVDSSETIHLRKGIRLSSDPDNRSVVQIKQEYIKKGDNENQILIPIKLHTSDMVKDIQNTLIVNKNSKTFSDKKYGVNNTTLSSVNCVRQSVNESDGASYLKARKITKLDDIGHEPNKKFKRNNEC